MTFWDNIILFYPKIEASIIMCFVWFQNIRKEFWWSQYINVLPISKSLKKLICIIRPIKGARMICSFSTACCEELREEGKWLSKESLLQTKASKNLLIQIVYNITHILQRISHNNDLINWPRYSLVLHFVSRLESSKFSPHN